MFSWALATALPARAASTQNLELRFHILNPPNAITDLHAAPVGIQDGDIQLMWTAPSNNNRIGIDHYAIRYTTYPATSAATADQWWTQQAASEQIITPAHAPGVIEFATVQGFTVNVKYYFGIKAIDRDGQLSPVDARVGNSNQAQSYPVNSSSKPPGTPTNFAGTALSTESIQWSWTASTGAGFYMLNAYPSGALITQTNNLTATEKGLTPNSAINRTLSAGNSNGISAPTGVQTVYTFAAVPVNFSTTNVGFTSISLAWSSAGNATGTQYRLERSVDGTNFTVLSLLTALNYTDNGLIEFTSYYYRLRAINGDGLITAPSAVVVAQTPLQVDFLSPAAPAGLKGSLDATGLAFTLTWEPVTQNSDGSPIKDLAGYNIYRRTSLTAGSVKITPVPLNVTAFADQVNNQTLYYSVRAVDTSGNESLDSLTADSSHDANVIYISSDGVSHVVMPESVNDLLRSAYNKYGVPLTIEMSEEPVADVGYILRTIRLNLVRTDTHEVLGDLAFAKPQATVAVGYNLVNGQVAAGAPNLDSTTLKTSANTISPSQLSLFWFNGVTWVKIGGTLNISEQSLSTKSSYLGSYQLRAKASATSLNLSQGNVYPRLFTPNGDGLNDRVYFVLENPNNTAVTGEIVDKQGRHVRTLLPPQTQTGVGYTMIWDGKDDKGVVVPGGVYIYKINGEGKSFTGSVGVAR